MNYYVSILGLLGAFGNLAPKNRKEPKFFDSFVV